MHDSVRRKGPGRYRIDLSSTSQLLLSELLDGLRDQLSGSTDEPHLQRLFPPAYANDPERDAGYQVLTRDEMLGKRIEALEIVDRTLGGGILDAEELTAWMTTLNSIRLVMGTKLDVDEELPPLDPEDPMAFHYAVYEYLGELLYLVVDALTDDLPPSTANAN